MAARDRCGELSKEAIMQYTEKQKDGSDLVRWKTDKKYTKSELEQQRNEFESAAKSGKVICLSDLMINHSM